MIASTDCLLLDGEWSESPRPCFLVTCFMIITATYTHTTTGPCGGRPAQEPQLALIAGRNFTVVFQKNVSHFNSTNPGES